MRETDDAAGLRELALRLRPRAQALAERTQSVYRAEISQGARENDPHVLTDITAVSLAGLRCWIDVLEQDREVDPEFLSPVLEVIRRRALQGVGMDAMMRAYRLTAKIMWQEILELPVDQHLVAPLSTRMLEFTDQLTTAAEQAYADETLRAVREPEAGRSAVFEAILSGRPEKDLYGVTWLPSAHLRRHSRSRRRTPRPRPRTSPPRWSGRRARPTGRPASTASSPPARSTAPTAGTC